MFVREVNYRVTTFVFKRVKNKEFRIVDYGICHGARLALFG